jgi:hypothetical protein
MEIVLHLSELASQLTLTNKQRLTFYEIDTRQLNIKRVYDVLKTLKNTLF